jgi:signal transduction histidine kinase
MEIPASPSSRPSGRLLRSLQVAAVVVIAMAIGADVVTTLLAGAPWWQFLPVLMVSAGVVAIFRRPLLALVLISAAPLVAAAAGHVVTAIWSITCFAGFVLVLRGLPALPTGAVLAAATFVGSAWYTGTIDPSVEPSAAVAPFAAAVCVAIASALRSSHRYRLEVEQRMREAETTRRTAVERGVATERLRIARDLHDSVGHRIAVVNMHLGAAEVHLPPGAEATGADLAAARAGVQAVLRETQQILTVLRVEGTGGASGAAFGHEHIADLVASSRAAGLRLEASIGDLDRPLSPPASAAAYRIVQEALTNAGKHGTGSVSLTITQDEDGTIVIDMHNLAAPDGTDPGIGGYGLIGMQERAASVGGTVETRAVGGVFTLQAIIPADGGRA